MTPTALTGLVVVTVQCDGCEFSFPDHQYGQIGVITDSAGGYYSVSFTDDLRDNLLFYPEELFVIGEL